MSSFKDKTLKDALKKELMAWKGKLPKEVRNTPLNYELQSKVKSSRRKAKR